MSVKRGMRMGKRAGIDQRSTPKYDNGQRPPVEITPILPAMTEDMNRRVGI